MAKILSKGFFNRPATAVARDLLGKFLVRKYRDKLIVSMITETEAYDGKEDLASHARFGKTARNQAMFGKGGYFYIYFTYGMHWMLNVVTERQNKPAAVLIRATKDVQGPGRLTKYFKINKKFNGLEVAKKTSLWFEDRGIKTRPLQIKAKKRVGVEYAGKWAKKLWNFGLE